MDSNFLIIGQLPPPHHGSNVMAEMFIQSLNSLEHHTTMVEKTFSKTIEDIGKLSILKILKVPIITSRLIYHLIKNKYDLCIYFFSIRPPSIFADAFFLFFIRMFRVKYILYLHAKGLIDLNEKVGWPLRSFVRKSISFSSGALVLGERLKKDITHLIPNENLFVLPNAIPDIGSINYKNSYKEKYPVKILYLSNIDPKKGPIEFLKMAQKINKIVKDVQFILAGPCTSDQFFSEIKEYILNENLIDNLVLTGPVYGEQKERLFRGCDIFVFPTHDEAFGLVNLEAMRAGLPVVSSNEGSIPEVIIDGVNGFIVDPKDIDMLTDRVLKLINDHELRTQMGKAGREIYEKKFTINSYRKRLAEGLKFFLNSGISKSSGNVNF
jgi:glycosyltransferase involved in cell wall biosynthesis